MAELPRVIIRLDDGEELVCEKNQLEHRQDVYSRKKVAEIVLTMKQSPHGLAHYYIARIDSNAETKTFNDHGQAVDWILEMLGLEDFK